MSLVREGKRGRGRKEARTWINWLTYTVERSGGEEEGEEEEGTERERERADGMYTRG